MELRTNVQKHVARCLSTLSLLGAISSIACPANADAAGDEKRGNLSAVKRVAVISPFFGTAALRQPEMVSTPSNGPAVARSTKYHEDLRRLQAHAQSALPERVTARTPFQLVPPTEMAKALETSGLTIEKLFENNGQMRGSKFAAPDAAAIKKFLALCHADAVILCALDEPRKTNGRYYFDGMGVGYDSAHVRDKAAFYVVSATGKDILHDFVEVLHPVSRLGNKRFLLADWTETEDEVIEDFLDELTRYLPESPGPGTPAHKSPRK